MYRSNFSFNLPSFAQGLERYWDRLAWGNRTQFLKLVEFQPKAGHELRIRGIGRSRELDFDSMLIRRRLVRLLASSAFVSAFCLLSSPFYSLFASPRASCFHVRDNGGWDCDCSVRRWRMRAVHLVNCPVPLSNADSTIPISNVLTPCDYVCLMNSSFIYTRAVRTVFQIRVSKADSAGDSPDDSQFDSDPKNLNPLRIGFRWSHTGRWISIILYIRLPATVITRSGRMKAVFGAVSERLIWFSPAMLSVDLSSLARRCERPEQ
ncbi:hypothetical protein R3P38DRAFT_3353954 [Favolaschia claudopus]|uniref:Uncharacterized protein n=1 Tax=Favolaschia claudopus TaxID=2862362 RepID=A0AAW0BTV4_9AGAR